MTWRPIAALLIAGLCTTPARAQDRLFLDGVEIGGPGRLGQPLGPARDLDQPLIAGGRLAIRLGSVVDLRTGATRALPLGAAIVALDPARARVFLAHRSGGAAQTFDLEAYDPVSGTAAPVASDACGAFVFGVVPRALALAYDADRAFYARCTSAGQFQDVADIDLRHVPPVVRVVPGVPDGDLMTTPDARRLFVFQSATMTAQGALMFDDLGHVGHAVINDPWPPGCAAVVVRSVPGAPRHAQASVTGRDVALDWANVGAASHFVLDVGFAPGRTDASVYLGSDSEAAFANVPPGTYYLRLRGGNEFGGGRPSNEVRVVVP